MQFITVAALLAAASFGSAQSVPASAPGCVKYCLRIAREQAPSACTWAGWCALSGFQDSVSNCYTNTCGKTNQQRGAEIYQQICSSAGSNTACPSGGASSTDSAIVSASSAVSSVVASASSVIASATSTTSDLVTTTFNGVATTVPASVASSIAAGLSSSAQGASSSAASVSSSVGSAASTATAPVSSAISSILSSASNAASSAASVVSSAASSPTANAASALGLPSYGQVVSAAALLMGAAAGALML